ncbi:MAG: bifunctional methionine sulfoxide reductase B/A protein [Planctomycetota bacterium]|nr:bifunctional methionine sulfoxide reductase B/A protein [Planctomycetota bacterium]
MPPLSDEEKHVILDKGTERPFTGKYWNMTDRGEYLCRQCGATLYRSESKFKSDCGWPSFDEEVPGAVRRQADADGRRTEILCARCGGHLGHVFEGEGYTAKNTRHCVNSVSMVFVPAGAAASVPASVPAKKPAAKPAAQAASDEAIFAGGCFWGVEHLFRDVPGVISAISGYSGGTVANPTYRQVCTGNTGHAESVRVVFDPAKVTYEQLAKRFFEVHDPTQLNAQGPDVGAQYRSAVFYRSEAQKKTAEKLIAALRANGYKVVTELTPAGAFYPAEDYHQNYIGKNPGTYCHLPVNRFEIPAGQ